MFYIEKNITQLFLKNSTSILIFCFSFFFIFFFSFIFSFIFFFTVAKL